MLTYDFAFVLGRGCVEGADGGHFEKLNGRRRDVRFWILSVDVDLDLS